MNLTSSITNIKGIGEKTAQAFEKLNIFTIKDVLFHFPRNYFRYPEAIRVDEITSLQERHLAIRAVVKKSPASRNGRTMNITTLTIGEAPKKLELVWFRAPYIKNQILPGKEYVFFGKMVVKNNRWVMEQPIIYTPNKYEEIAGMLQPVYALTSGVTNNLLIKTMKNALCDFDLVPDYIPADIRKENHLCEYNYALKQIHFPDTMESLIEARRCLVFHEFFLFIMGIQYQKEKKTKDPNNFTFKKDSFLEDCIKKLPYPLTNAQKKALKDIQSDMDSPFVMQRLIQGDVGSGKTIVAFLTMARCAHSGYQSAIMAPTEVLARQHYEGFTKLCKDFDLDYPVVLLTGSMKAKEKKEAYAKLESCPNALVVGTHALIQEKAVYSNLSLVITDEQHRFGVKQRDVFMEKGRGRR